MNNDTIEIGQELKSLKEFSLGMSDRHKGEAIGNSDLIRKVHNSFARQDPFTVEDDGVSGVGSEDVFHFVSYVPHNGKLYELDGLQDGPICFGDCTAEDWVNKAREEIQKRIEKYAASEIRFNVLAVIQDKIDHANEKIAQMTAAGQTDEAKEQELVIADETQKRKQWSEENARRRHNFVPLIFELLQQFAKKQMLAEMFDDAQKAKKKKIEEKKNEKAKK